MFVAAQSSLTALFNTKACVSLKSGKEAGIINSTYRERLVNPGAITSLLERMNSASGDARKEIYNQLVVLLYDDLRRRARHQLRNERADSLRPTILVHEAYERMMGYRIAFNNREHFINVASTAMRRYLVERARKVRSVKRGGGQIAAANVGDEGAVGIISADPELLIDIDSALETLRPEQVQLVELRFFVGFTLEETAEILGIKLETAKKRWLAVKTLLFDRLETRRRP
jgi:RNA polymerase sigma factor (TIGR02999 family)